MREKIIAICTANFYTETSRNMVNAISRICKDNGFSVWVFNAFSEFNYEEINDKAKESVFNLLEITQCSAVVILTPTIQNVDTIHRIRIKAQALQVPVISYEMEMEGCNNILFDYVNAFSEEIEHLIEVHDCKHINMIAGRKNNAFSEERIRIFKDTLKRHNIDFSEKQIAYGDFWEFPAMRAMQSFIDDEDGMPDAVVCANDTMAMAACQVLKADGFSVPEDIIITGFDGIEVEKHHFPRLTTAVRDFEKAGELIIKTALDFYENGVIKPNTIVVPIHNVYSQSCGCPHEENRDVNDIIKEYQAKIETRTWDDYVLNNLSIREEAQGSFKGILKQYGESLALWNMSMYQLFILEDSTYSYDVHMKPENMLLAIHWEDGHFSVPLKKESDWKQCYDRYPIIVFSLVIEREQVFGYSATAYQYIDDTIAHRLFKFTNHIGHMLSVEANKERLHRLNEELQKKNAEIEEMSIRDPLTKIYNRRGFQQTLYQMVRNTHKKYIMLASLDMDKLKHINDNYGHIDGDFAISSFAKVLSALCGKYDFCARFGGDEFVFVSFTDNRSKPEIFKEALYQKLDELKDEVKKPYPITGSCGFCMVEVEVDLDEEAILQKADAAMYENKKQRKGNRQ